MRLKWGHTMAMACRLLSRLFIQLEHKKAIINVRAIHAIALEYDNKINRNQSKYLFKLSKSLLVIDHNLGCISRRWNYGKNSKKGRNQEENDDEDENKVDEEVELLAHGKNNKIITPNTSSMRIDAVVKAGLGIARNKADVALYESKIRINSGKVLKKGYQVNINDVIDYIVGPSPKNSKFTIVNRITILDANPNGETIKLKVLREKNLVVDDYADSYKVESVD